MAKNTLTFELGGQVELKDLEKGINLFKRLVHALTPRKGVTWIVQDLQPGSAIITLEGRADVASKVEKIVEDYENIGSYLQIHQHYQEDFIGPPLSKARAVKAAGAIQDFLKTSDSLEYVRLQTPDNGYTIYGNHRDVAQTSTARVSIGSVTGRVRTLSNRPGLRFNLYDKIHDKAVVCYLKQEQEALMREAWGKWVRVSGRVYRKLGLPISIRDIMEVEILENPDPWAYRNARGVIPWKPGDKLPEQVIREMRDAE